MHAKVFWKLGLTYLALLLIVLIAADFYSASVLRTEYIRAASDELTALAQITKTRPPERWDININDLGDWARRMAASAGSY